MKKIILLANCFFLTACSSVYKPPTEGAVAQLTFPAKTAQYKEDYYIAVSAGNGCGEAFQVNTANIEIPARNEILISYKAATFTGSCTGSFFFDSEPNKHYYLSLLIKDKRCHMRLLENHPEGMKQTPLMIAYTTPWSVQKICRLKSQL